MRGNGRKVCAKERKVVIFFYSGRIVEIKLSGYTKSSASLLLCYSKLVTLTGLDIKPKHRRTHVDSFIVTRKQQVEKLCSLLLDN